MGKEVTQREALEKMIEIGRNFLESTRNHNAESCVARALEDLAAARDLMGEKDCFRHKDPVLHTEVDGAKVRI
jgi:hypothetical protein